jgi:5-methylcytosine-specific restriction endonuclease McrA
MRHKCYVCSSKNELERHHKIPRFVGGHDIPANFVYLCHNHHQQIHKFFTRKNPIPNHWIRQLEFMRNRHQEKLLLVKNINV